MEDESQSITIALEFKPETVERLLSGTNYNVDQLIDFLNKKLEDALNEFLSKKSDL